MNPMLLSRLFAAQQEPQWGPNPYAQQNYGVPPDAPPRHMPQMGPHVDNAYPAMGAEGEDAGAFAEPDVMPSFEEMFGADDAHGVQMLEPSPITGPGPQITEVPDDPSGLSLEQIPSDLWGQQGGAAAGGGPLGAMYAPPIRGGRMTSR